MKIIIAGAGEVGYHLAKQLSNEAHDISVIDAKSEPLSRIDAYTDVLSIQGSSTSIEVLQDANIDKTELVIAVTSSESVNINTAILAKKLGAHKAVARVGNAEYITEESRALFKELGIDHLIYPEELAAQEIVKLIKRAAATDVLDFENGKLSLIGLKMDHNAPIIRRSLKDLAVEYKDFPFRIVAIHRGVRTIIPAGNDTIQPNDQVFVVTAPEAIDHMIDISGKEKASIENLMILGGGKIGRRAAKLLEDEVEIKLIENNTEKTIELADYLHKSLVIQGDGRDIDLLAQEGIIDMDAFISVTNDAETNIITCLMAKHLQVQKTIALVDNVDYIPLTQTIGLDSLINKKLIAANNITRFVRRANVVEIATLQGVDADIYEYIAKPGSKITKKQVKNLNFPKDAIIGGYVRNDKGYITVGDTQFEANDKVVVFALPGAINKVEKFFN